MSEDNSINALSLDLPFYANGTLDDEASARIEAALKTDEVLRGELEIIRKTQAQMKGQLDETALNATSANEDRLEALMHRITAEPYEPSASADQAITMSSPAANDNTFIQKLLPVAAALLLAISVGQFAYINSGFSGASEKATYTTLSGEEVSNVRSDFLIEFDEAASWADIEALLGTHDLRIIDGPYGALISTSLYLHDEVEAEILEQIQSELSKSPIIINVVLGG